MTPIRNGLLEFDPAFLSSSDADTLFLVLINQVPWKQETGRFGPTPRLTAWYADDGITYRYSGILHTPLPWLPQLHALREQLQARCDAVFNSALLNRYRDGRDSMGWHADDEPELGTNPVIASVSLGGTRRFRLRHNTTRETLDFDLSHGSLLIMAGAMQHHWQHAIPKTAKPVSERINLTFRQTAPAAPARPSRQGVAAAAGTPPTVRTTPPRPATAE